MINIFITVFASCVCVPLVTHFFNRRSCKKANSEADILDAISKLKADIYSADSGLTIISRDMCAFATNGTGLVDNNIRYFSLNKLQLERDWETYGYHFKNRTIKRLMNKLFDELKMADDSVMKIKCSGQVSKYTFYASERPEVEELCSLIDAQRRKIIK